MTLSEYRKSILLIQRLGYRIILPPVDSAVASLCAAAYLRRQVKVATLDVFSQHTLFSSTPWNLWKEFALTI